MQLMTAIFDMDGTLLDSMPVWDKCSPLYLTRNGKTPKPDLRRRQASMSMTQIAEFYQSEYGVDKPAGQIIDEINALAFELYQEVEPKKGVPEFLRFIKEKGVATCVATATDRVCAQQTLERLGLWQYIDEMTTCTEVGFGKDHPDIFEVSMAHLGGTKENTVIFEDSLYAIDTAKKAGFAVCATPDASAKHNEDKIREISDWFVDNFYESKHLLFEDEPEIRVADEKDVSRIAEMIVFNNRINFFPIFGGEQFSFGKVQVMPIAQEYLEHKDWLSRTYVAEQNGVVKGFIRVNGNEVEKLYVEPHFQCRGIGARLLDFAVEKDEVRYLWALEKNVRGIAFYGRHGFFPNGEKQFEEGTTEYLVKLVRK